MTTWFQNRLTTELANKQIELDNKDQLYRDTQAELKLVIDAHNELTSDYETLADYYIELRNQDQLLKKNFSDLTAQHNLCSSLIAEQDETICLYQTKLRPLKMLVGQLEAKLDLADQTNLKLTGQVNLLASCLTHQERDLTNAAELLASKNEEIESGKLSYQKSQQELVQLKESQIQEREQQEAVIVDLQTQVELLVTELRGEKQMGKAQIRSYNQKIKALWNIIHQFQAEIETQTELTTEKIAQMEQDIESQKKELITINREFKKLTKQLTKKTRTIEKSDQKLKRARRRITSVKQQIADLKQGEKDLQATQQILAKILVEINADLNHEKNRADNLQAWKDNHTCSCPNSCCGNGDYDDIKQQRDYYQGKLTDQDQKITDLEKQLKAKDKIIAELKNKPPLSPVVNNQEPSSTTPKSSPDNLTETPNPVKDQQEQLLATIQQQQTTIQELQIKLKTAEAKTPPPVIKEITKIDLKLQQELKDKEQTITQWRYLCLLSCGIGILLMINTIRLLARPRRLKK